MIDIETLGSFFEKYSYLKEILATIAVILCFILVRFFVKRKVNQRKDLNKSDKVAIQRRINLYSNIFLLFLVLLLWFSQIQALFVSMLAVAAALVLATKEIIMCITGGILVFVNKSFKNGDRIEVDGLRGYITERNLTATKILEIGPEKNSQQTTGSIITIPNSLFLTKSLKNESYFQGYSINSFSFRLPKEFKLTVLENFILSKSNEICSNYLEKAKKYISRFCEREGLDIPSIEPRSKVVLDEKDEINVLLKMPVINSEVARIEQELLRSYIKFMEDNKVESIINES